MPAAAVVEKGRKTMNCIERFVNLTFSKSVRREDENWGYAGTNTNGTAFQIIFFFRTGEWNYTIFAENAVQLTEEKNGQLRTRYENWMKKLDLLPENVDFQNNILFGSSSDGRRESQQNKTL